jgi:hypothetical protein
MSVTIIVTTSTLFRIQLDQGINTHDCDACLDCGLQLLHFAHTWLEDTSLQTVVHLAVRQVQTVVLVVLRLRQLLRILGRGVGWVHCPL